LGAKHLLEAKNIISGYGKIQILFEPSITVNKGSIVGIIGPNGSGKSTFLKAIYGLIPVWSGVVKYEGEDVSNTKPSEKLRIGTSYLAQRHSVFPDLTVEENLKMGIWILRHKEDVVREKIEDVYTKFPALRERKALPAGALSGGEQRMLELGRSLMTEPRLIILDEFSAGIAPKIADELYEHLAILRKDKEISILAVEQNVKRILSLADYIYVMKIGRISREGSSIEINRNLHDIVSDWLKA